MKTLSSPPTVYIHHASLETLHAESVEWLNDLSFWREEMSFFYRLLRNKEIICLLPARELEMVDQEMIKLTSEGLAEMGKKVEQHEQNLKKAIHPVLLCEEQRYREMHKLLLSQMHHIYAQVKEFKKKILSFITKYEYLSDRINRKNKY